MVAADDGDASEITELMESVDGVLDEPGQRSPGIQLYEFEAALEAAGGLVLLRNEIVDPLRLVREAGSGVQEDPFPHGIADGLILIAPVH